MKKWMIVLLAVLLVVLACVGYIIWKNTVNQSAAVEEKPYSFEESAAKLIPVNMSCEDKGFRVTVMGALLTDRYLWIEYDIHDLEGGRLNHNYIFQNIEEWLDYNMDIKYTSGSANYVAAEPDHSYVIQKCMYNRIDSQDTLSVKLKSLPAMEKTSIQILPLLEQYGKSYEGVPVPSGKGWHMSYPTDMVPDEIRFIDSSLSLEQPFSDDPAMKNLLLGGIGWIDGRLHIQIHNADKNLKISSGSFYTGPVTIHSANRESNILSGNTIKLMWDEDSDYNMDWVEYAIEYKPEELEELDYYLDLYYIREILEGNWEFNIPLDQIRASSDVAAELDAQKDPMEDIGRTHIYVYNETGEAVTEIKMGSSTCRPSDGEGFPQGLLMGFGKGSESEKDRTFSYKTKSGYEYETTLHIEADKQVNLTLLSQEDGGGIKLTYLEPDPTVVPAGS
ncbi:hypothetical protein SAMN06297421_11414 [Aristaeella hokkaidonensis]|nr:hypothetical protein SAMN06297421_11414 [Aristaeella hokkaidonensis]